MRSQQVWFQTLVQGAAVADQWVLAAAAGAAVPWPAFFVQMATANAAQTFDDSPALPWSDLERQSLSAVLLAATPLLLQNVNRYGHRQAWVRQRAETWGLSPTAIEALGGYFGDLCRGLPTDGLEAKTLGGGLSALTLGTPAALAPVYARVHDSQGQFWLVLEQSRQAGWTSSDSVLAAVLALVAGSAVPLALRQRYLGPEPWDDRWLGYGGNHLQQLGFQLYARWAGLRVGAMTQGGRPIMASDLGVE